MSMTAYGRRRTAAETRRDRWLAALLALIAAGGLGWAAYDAATSEPTVCADCDEGYDPHYGDATP